jgi:polyisoprenoid-binding protein YceI
MSKVNSSSSLHRAALALTLLGATGALAAWSKQGEGTASFLARGPAGLKIVGSTRSVEVKDDGKDFTVTVKILDLDTDNSLRNRHMLEDIEAEKFPLASLTLPSASVKEGASDADGKGTYSMHGKSKEVPFKYSTRCGASTCDVEASLELNVKDYDVKIRSYLGITTKDDVSVSIKFQLKK